MLLNSTIDFIVVPQGAEQKAVRQGISAAKTLGNPITVPTVLSIPIGPQTVSSHLKTLQSRGQLSVKPGCNVLLMGLGGSLSPKYHVGDVVLTSEMSLISDQMVISSVLAYPPLVQTLYSSLQRVMGPQYCLGIEKGITCDRVITGIAEKQTLNQVHGARVVDMEGEPVIRFFQSLEANVAVLRVISDNHDVLLPDFNKAIDAKGHLHLGAMVWQCLKRPFPTIRLIRSGLTGLSQLRTVTRYCLAPTASIK